MIKIKYPVFLFFFLYSNFVLACGFKGPDNVGLFLSPDKKFSKFFNLKNGRQFRPFYKLSDCNEKKKKYAEIVVGVVEDYIDNSSSTTILGDNYRPLECKVENSSHKGQSAKERKETYLERRKFLTKCLDVFITDTGSAEIKFPENQKGCLPEKVDPKKIRVNGQSCYLENQENSTFVFNFELKKECLDKDYLEENKIIPQEFISNVGFYFTNDTTGRGVGVETAGMTNIRVIVNPDERLFKTAPGYGENDPSYPSQWTIPNVELGELKFENFGNSTKIWVPFVADNRCKTNCENGICSSPCHYNSPLSGEVTLYEVVEGKKDEFLATWYTGGIMLGNWQGMVRGIPYVYNGKLENDKFYKIEVLFRDPHTDFKFLKKAYESLLGKIPNNFSNLRIGGMINEIDPIRPNRNLVIPFRSLGVVGGNPNLNALRKGVLRFHSLFDYAFWPPYYEEVCDENIQNCFRSDELLFNAKLTASFKYEWLQDSKKYNLKDLVFSRESKIVSAFERPISKLPVARCEKAKPLPVPPRPAGFNRGVNVPQ
jgi:hypothetical protein